MSKILYLHNFRAQVSQSVSLAYLTVFDKLELYDLKCQKTHISAISAH